jgi:uncharacterized membrane protein
MTAVGANQQLALFLSRTLFEDERTHLEQGQMGEDAPQPPSTVNL